MGLNWESTYELALALRQAHPGVDLAGITLAQLYAWTMALPEFADEASLCNEEILMSIFQEWYEVTINA
ncbi:MAG TPA: Fe-S cluster assembly protein IscX [Anaerolineales bacterium]|nr:Fe-S cluster assembly protein IscX [Anaerolineales bacterium]